MEESEFDFGDIVFLKTDPDQLERQITGYIMRPNSIAYELSCGVETSIHYGFEISREIDILKKVKSSN